MPRQPTGDRPLTGAERVAALRARRGLKTIALPSTTLDAARQVAERDGDRTPADAIARLVEAAARG